MYFESGWDGVLVLSRENSEKYFLSRENSLTRENSEKSAIGKDLFDQFILSRENSDHFGNRTGAVALSRENSDKLSVLLRTLHNCLTREYLSTLTMLASMYLGVQAV